MVFNAHGILHQLAEFTQFIVDYSIDIILLTETWLQPTSKLHIPGFTIHRTDRQTGRGGGTAIIIRNHLVNILLPNLVSDQIESTTILLSTPKQGELQISSVYCPPTNRLYPQDLTKLLFNSNPTIIAGDFNARHISWDTHSNDHGTTLHNFSTRHPTTRIVAPKDPTFHRGQQSSVIDIAVMNNISQPLSMQTIQDLRSDHFPVLIHLNYHCPAAPPVTYFKRDWEAYKEHLSNVNMQSFNTSEDKIEQLTIHIKEALERSKETVTSNPPSMRQLPSSIKKLIKLKNRARRLHQKYRQQIYKENYNYLHAKVRAAVKEHRDKLWKRKISTITDNTTMWKFIGTLKGREKPPIPPLLKPNGTWALTDQEKADFIATTFQSSFTLHNIGTKAAHQTTASRSRRQIPPLPNPDTEPEFTTLEVKRIVEHLNPNKAPGPDGINASALRHLPSNFIQEITDIFNQLWEQGDFPTTWKTSTIIGIPKSTRPSSNPSNLRPIALLPVISKVYEKLLLSRMQIHEEEHHFLKPEQFGFRKQHSTELQILRLTEDIHDNLNKRYFPLVIFIDFARAFDSVWHDALLLKLCRLQYPPQVIHTIKNFLRNRSYRIKVNDSISNPKPIHSGVPQGSCLSPALFNLFLQDFPTVRPGKLYLYADDVAILVATQRKSDLQSVAQAILDRVTKFCNRWRLQINASKTKIVPFGKRTFPFNSLRIQGQAITFSTSAKYLGVTFNSYLTWKLHIDATINKVKSTYPLLFPLLYTRSSLSLETKLLLFRTILLPKILYGSSSWITVSNENLNRLQRLVNRILRQICQVPRYTTNASIRQMTNIPLLRWLIQEQLILALERIEDHPNDLLQASIQYPLNSPVRSKRPRHMLLQPLPND